MLIKATALFASAVQKLKETLFERFINSMHAALKFEILNGIHRITIQTLNESDYSR